MGPVLCEAVDVEKKVERVQDQQGTRSTGRIRVVYVVMSSLDLNSSPVCRALGHAAII
jgi:hypothetical protein